MHDTLKESADTWRKVDSEQIADCEVFSVHRATFERETDGEKADFFVIENPDWVNIIGVTKDRKAIFIEQYRQGTESMIFEIPGGMVEDGDDPESTARRELAEETGFTTDRIICVGRSYPNPAQQSNTIYHFLALDCTQTEQVNFDEHESIATRLVPLQQIDELVHNGTINHSLAVTALYYAQKYLKDEGLIT